MCLETVRVAGCASRSADLAARWLRGLATSALANVFGSEFCSNSLSSMRFCSLSSSALVCLLSRAALFWLNLAEDARGLCSFQYTCDVPYDLVWHADATRSMTASYPEAGVIGRDREVVCDQEEKFVRAERVLIRDEGRPPADEPEVCGRPPTLTSSAAGRRDFKGFFP